MKLGVNYNLAIHHPKQPFKQRTNGGYYSFKVILTIINNLRKPDFRRGGTVPLCSRMLYRTRLTVKCPYVGNERILY